jgi:hypothetical protein
MEDRSMTHHATGKGLLGAGIALTLSKLAPLHAQLVPSRSLDPQKLLAPVPVAGDRLGLAVGLERDTLIVAAPYSANGSVEAYRRGASGWLAEQTLAAPDGAPGDRFGFRVCLDGHTAIVGAPKHDASGPDAGAAYVFIRDGSGWTQEQKLVPGDAAAGDQNGWSVAIQGDTALVGAPTDDDAGSNSGAAYVFVRTGPTWTQQQKLVAPDAEPGDLFGWSVAIDGDTAVVGATNDDDLGSNSGSVHVFVRSGGVWTHQQKLMASNGAADQTFGYALALDRDTCVVGRPRTGSGSAFVMRRSGGAWTQEQELHHPSLQTNDWFGCSVAIDGDTAVVGAKNADGAGSNTGCALVFVRSPSGTWYTQRILAADDAATDDELGYDVDLCGHTALVGSPLNNEAGADAGAAYVFDQAGDVFNNERLLLDFRFDDPPGTAIENTLNAVDPADRFDGDLDFGSSATNGLGQFDASGKSGTSFASSYVDTDPVFSGRLIAILDVAWDFDIATYDPQYDEEVRMALISNDPRSTYVTAEIFFTRTAADEFTLFGNSVGAMDSPDIVFGSSGDLLVLMDVDLDADVFELFYSDDDGVTFTSGGAGTLDPTRGLESARLVLNEDFTDDTLLIDRCAVAALPSSVWAYEGFERVGDGALSGAPATGFGFEGVWWAAAGDGGDSTTAAAGLQYPPGYPGIHSAIGGHGRVTGAPGDNAFLALGLDDLAEARTHSGGEVHIAFLAEMVGRTVADAGEIDVATRTAFNLASEYPRNQGARLCDLAPNSTSALGTIGKGSDWNSNGVTYGDPNPLIIDTWGAANFNDVDRVYSGADFADGVDHVVVSINPATSTYRVQVNPRLDDTNDAEITFVHTDGAAVVPFLMRAFGVEAGNDSSSRPVGDMVFDEIYIAGTFRAAAGFPQSPCPGDRDGDGDVDVFDFAIFATAFGQTGLPPFAGSDLNGDGAVDVFDFAIFAVNFGCTP